MPENPVENNELSIKQILDDVKRRHAPGSIRYYALMLRRLKEFNGGDTLHLGKLGKNYIERYKDYLVRLGMTPTTVRQMLKFFRASLKPFLTIEKQREIRRIFHAVAPVEQAGVNMITHEDIKKIAHAKNLPDPLEKIRLLFLCELFSCGHPIDNPQQFVETPQLEKIQSIFFQKFGVPITVFKNKLSDRFQEGLKALSAYLRLSRDLTPESPLNGWISVACHLKISPEMIASIISAEHPISRSIIPLKNPSDEDKQAVVQKVNHYIWDLKQHWYALRCLRKTPEEINGELYAKLPLGEDDMFQVFIVPPTPKKLRKLIGSSPIEKILFFRTYHSVAEMIRKTNLSQAHLFTTGKQRRPAIIQDSEMQTFMLLCRLSPDTIFSYFPDKEENTLEIPIGTEMKITDGQLSGHVGIVKKISPESYTVTLVIHTLGNLHITADIPASNLSI